MHDLIDAQYWVVSLWQCRPCLFGLCARKRKRPNTHYFDKFSFQTKDILSETNGHYWDKSKSVGCTEVTLVGTPTDGLWRSETQTHFISVKSHWGTMQEFLYVLPCSRNDTAGPQIFSQKRLKFSERKQTQSHFFVGTEGLLFPHWMRRLSCDIPAAAFHFK